MIGVVARDNQVALVDEFFELFKTPWEFWRPDRRYDVVIVTAGDIPDIEARLLLIYGAEPRRTDAASGIRVRSRRQGGQLEYRGAPLPVYRDVATFDASTSGPAPVVSDGAPAGVRLRSGDATVMRLGYDLFDEIECLLAQGQPANWAHVPTLDLHIMMLRDAMVEAGITFVEIPPVPSGYRLAVCLSHDIDFVGIRDHRFDHTMWGFLYRSTVGAFRNWVRRRIPARRLFETWRAVVALPFVHLGWAKDFWNPFDWYLRVEQGLPATYFLIPFKRRQGAHVPGPHAARRATAYDVTDIPQWTSKLRNAGCELGVHGIDAWHSVDKGRQERARIADATDASQIGIRMHWLLRNEDTVRVLEAAGYAYDSSHGYNETVGYRSGTTQVFRPLTACDLLELPMHIQDGALFYPHRLDLPEPAAWDRCMRMIGDVHRFGGVLTVLWHDRSHGPERFWGDFYERLVAALKSRDVWFGTAARIVEWFQKRRDVTFEVLDTDNGTAGVRLRCAGKTVHPPLNIRLHRKSAVVDTPWTGESAFELRLDVNAQPATLAGVS